MGGQETSRRSFVRMAAGATTLAVGVGAVGQPVAATGGDIDIKPGSDPNSFNPCSKGVIPVELRSPGNYQNEPLPGSTAIVDTLRFGPPRVFGSGGNVGVSDIEESIASGDGAGPLHGGHEEGDSLVLHFSTEAAGFESGDETGMLIGEFVWPGDDDTRYIRATDSVNLVGCGKDPDDGKDKDKDRGKDKDKHHWKDKWHDKDKYDRDRDHRDKYQRDHDWRGGKRHGWGDDHGPFSFLQLLFGFF